MGGGGAREREVGGGASDSEGETGGERERWVGGGE